MKKSNSDEAQKTIKTDPSVSVLDMYQKGEPAGCVPLERTMRKPDAYYPCVPGPK